jgi:hypothetical protein
MSYRSALRRNPKERRSLLHRGGSPEARKPFFVSTLSLFNEFFSVGKAQNFNDTENGSFQSSFQT